MHCRRVACSCRICAGKAARKTRDARKPQRAPSADALAAEPNRPVEVRRLPTDDRAPSAHMRAPRHHLAGFVAALARAAPALTATVPRAVVVAACVGTARSRGQLVVEMVSCLKASWVRCILAMPPPVQRACLLRLAGDSRRRDCLVCLRSKTALCVRAAHAYWLDAGCVTLAVVAVATRATLCQSCAQRSLTERDGLPRAWDFMNAKGWRRKNGFTHLPHVNWIVQRNGTLVDPRGRVRGWTPVYPPPSLSWSPSDARAVSGADRFAPFPETDHLLLSFRSLSDALSRCIASYAPVDERERLLLASRPIPTAPSPPPHAATVIPPPPPQPRARPRKPPRPSARSERPRPPARPDQAAIVYSPYNDATTQPEPVADNNGNQVPQRTAVAQASRSRLACASGARCPAPSQMVHTDKRHVRVECDAGCCTRYHGACWRNRRTEWHGGGGVSAAAHADRCPTPDCWGALVRVVSVGGAGLVEHVVWSRDPGSDVAPRASDAADARGPAVQRRPLTDPLRDRLPVGNNHAPAAATAEPDPERQARAVTLLPRDVSLPTAQTTTTTTMTTTATTATAGCDRSTLAVASRADRSADHGDDDGDNGPPSIYDIRDRARRKKAPRVRAQKRQRVRAREKATWSADVVGGPLVADSAAVYGDDLLWPEFFRP